VGTAASAVRASTASASHHHLVIPSKARNLLSAATTSTLSVSTPPPHSVLATQYSQLFLEYPIQVNRSAQRSIPAKLATSLAVAALLTTLAAAQRAHPVAPHAHAPTGSFAFAQNAHPSALRRSPRTSLPFPFLDDFFNSEDIYSTGYPVSSQPPAILLQAVRALSGTSNSLAQPKNQSKPASPHQPLMLELQNGRYVRINSTAANGELLPDDSRAQASTTSPVKRTIPKSTSPASSHAQNLPPAILVFHDGRTEEVRDYTIADGTLYARGDYYTDGYWNKKIDLSTLNVAETLQANAARQVKFVLPASPNEVITRP
jgi:hypothetical protein